MRTPILIILVLILLYLVCQRAHADEVHEGVVLDKWSVTKKVCYFDGYCPKKKTYFVSIDSIYDDLSVPEERYIEVQIGKFFRCSKSVCTVQNEMNFRDKNRGI